MKSSITNVETPINEEVFHEKWTKDHPLYKIIGDPKSSVRTRGQLANSCLFSCLLSSIEPANVAEALRDADWVSAMQEELDQFARLKVWRLAPRHEGKYVIKTKWIFKNKKDESSLVIRNKARLVTVGYSQQEGIHYDETFVPIARIEAIRLILAYAAHKDFTVFHMDRISSNPRNRQIAQPGMNMGQDRQMQMVGGNGGNQFRQHAGQNVGNLNGYNDVQNVRNQVIQHAVQNLRIQNVRNQNGLIGVPGNANQNSIGNCNLVAARAEGNTTRHNGN
nr:retrovirus-related Pol polyprotein from transposon TNT 1-94 [Tanacetum cinerariifolium]